MKDKRERVKHRKLGPGPTLRYSVSLFSRFVSRYFTSYRYHKILIGFRLRKNLKEHVWCNLIGVFQFFPKIRLRMKVFCVCFLFSDVVIIKHWIDHSTTFQQKITISTILQNTQRGTHPRRVFYGYVRLSISRQMQHNCHAVVCSAFCYSFRVIRSNKNKIIYFILLRKVPRINTRTYPWFKTIFPRILITKETLVQRNNPLRWFETW